MKRSGNTSSVHKGMSISIILSVFIVLIVLIVGVSTPNQVYGWNSDNCPVFVGSTPPYSAHFFIINKAIEYLRRPEINLLPDWPLEDYATNINYGAWYADNPRDSVGHYLVCDWKIGYSGVCEPIHHYFSSDCIRLMDITPNPCVAYTGGLAVPEYAQTLYDLAVKFWPGGVPPPKIHDLTYLDSGGSITNTFSGASLGPFVIGALPFAALLKAIQAGYDNPDYVRIEDAYTWPGFTDGSESVKAALTYLGWAIHLIEDVNTPVHAKNETGSVHQAFEDRADQLIMEGKMSHLPVNPADKYYYPYNIGGDRFYSTRPNFFNNDWSMEQFANESAHLAIEASNPPLPPGDDIRRSDAEIEADLDEAIKMVAGILYKFFSQIQLPKDRFEPNNSEATASVIGSGFYDNLTIHAPWDEDYYQLTVDQDYSDVQIAIDYDVMNHDLNLVIYKQKCEGGHGCYWGWPEPDVWVTPNGRMYQEKYVRVGTKYLIWVEAFDNRLPSTYSLNVHAGKGDLPPDRYEPNDSPSTATPLPGTLPDTNIHNNSDVDYYKFNAYGWSVQAQITFDPSHGNLELFLDDVEATNFTLSADGTKKTLQITGCGKSPSYARVQGERNFYSISVDYILLQAGCPGYSALIPLRGSGTFTYTYPPIGPGSPWEGTATAREGMYAHKDSESFETVLWSVGAWLDIPGPGNLYFPLVVELSCNKRVGVHAAQVDGKILNMNNLNQVTWFGRGDGECYLDEVSQVMTGFNATINLTSIPNLVHPAGAEGTGVVTIEGHSPESPIAHAGGPYTGTVGSAITFDASGSFEPNGTIVLYEWDWNNDGIYEECTKVPQIRHTWTTPFSGAVKLKVTDSGGLTAVDTASASIKSLLFRISGGAYFYPESATYRATFSMDVTGPTSPSGWLKYYYARTRMNFVSTGITSASASGNTATISGSGTVNGASGYTFTATMTNGSPDTFGIVIKKSDGTTYYSAGPKNISGGDLVIQ